MKPVSKKHKRERTTTAAKAATAAHTHRHIQKLAYVCMYSELIIIRREAHSLSHTHTHTGGMSKQLFKVLNKQQQQR